MTFADLYGTIALIWWMAAGVVASLAINSDN
jgi:hypothetical protein